jgi:hypothetical protein
VNTTKAHNRQQQNQAVAAGKCYICLEHEATVEDGIGSKLCPECTQTIQQALIQNALTPGYSLKKRSRK